MNQKQKIIIFVIISIILICGVIFAWYYFETLKKPIILPEKETLKSLEIIKCSQLENDYERDYCYRDLAISNQDILICDKIQNQETRDWCYSDIAILKQDYYICEKIQNRKPKNRCYRAIGLLKQGPLICDEMKDKEEKHLCYLEIARSKQDFSICERIQDQSLKDRCYEKIAILKLDSLICENIIQTDWVGVNCYTEIAKSKKDPKICDLIPLGYPPNIFWRDKCYVEVAYIKGDLSICKLIEDDWQKTLCHIKIERRKQEILACEKYEKIKKDICYANIAIVKRDSKICKKIKEYHYKNWCFKTIEKQFLSPEEVVSGFFHSYINKPDLKNRTDITEEYKQRIALMREELLMFDPIIFAQEIPGERIIVNRAIIANNSAFLYVHLKYSTDHINTLKVELLLIDNQWKINNISDVGSNEVHG